MADLFWVALFAVIAANVMVVVIALAGAINRMTYDD